VEVYLNYPAFFLSFSGIVYWKSKKEFPKYYLDKRRRFSWKLKKRNKKNEDK